MSMTRPKIEKAILSVLADKLEGLYSIPTKPDKNNSSLAGRFYTFTRIVNESTFKVRLRFYGQNALKLETDFWVSNQQVDDFLVNHGFPKEMGTPSVVYFDMETFLTGDIAGGAYLQHGRSLDAIDTTQVANKICDRYFDFVNKDCIPTMDTAFKLEALLNDPSQFRDDGTPDVRYSWPMQSKILNGVVLALICKRQGYEDLLETYRTIIKKRYQPNQYELIDFCIGLLGISY